MKKITLKNLAGLISRGFVKGIDARNLKVENLKASDVCFEESNVEGLTFVKCQFENLSFHGCFFNKIIFSDCLIKKIEIDDHLISQQLVSSGMLCLGHKIDPCMAIILDEFLVPERERPKCAENHINIPNSEIGIIYVAS
jgi:hypothetical protein